jgi:hypothetical protein
MPHRSHRTGFILLLILGITMACGPCNLLSGNLPTPPRPISVAPESAEQLEADLQSALNAASGAPVIVHATDQEVTSLISTELARIDEAPVTDLQVWFTRGKINATGWLVNVLPVKTTFYLEALATLDGNAIQVDIERISAGTIPIPRSVLNTFSRTINETVDELQLDFEVTDLEILEGEVIIRGVRK